MGWQQLLPWLACHAVPDWLYVGLIVPNVGPSVRLIVPNEQFVPNDISDWTPTPMDSSWPRRYQSGRCYCQKHFSFFEAFMIWYTHHSWKKLEGNHFKNLWETIFLALSGFDQKLQLRYLWYCDTRPQRQAFKKIFDVIAHFLDLHCVFLRWIVLSCFDQEDHQSRQETKATRRQCRALRNPSACQHLTFELEKHLKIIFRIKYHPKISIFHLSNATHRRRESIHCFCLSGVLFDVVT